MIDVRVAHHHSIHVRGLEAELAVETIRLGPLALEQATRNVQTLEDQIKLSIRNQLRVLLESRETLKIQAQSVAVAEKRVRSSNLFLEAGRIQIRDLLVAQDDRLAARNDLTAAVISYRIAELALQRDMGVLNVNEDGLWQEFVPEVKNHAAKQDAQAETRSHGLWQEFVPEVKTHARKQDSQAETRSHG